MQNSPIQSLQTHARHFGKGSHCPLQALSHPSRPRIPSAVSRSRWLQHDSARWMSPLPDSIWSQRGTNRCVGQGGDHGQSHKIQQCHWRIPLCWGGVSWKIQKGSKGFSLQLEPTGHFLLHLFHMGYIGCKSKCLLRFSSLDLNPQHWWYKAGALTIQPCAIYF